MSSSAAEIAELLRLARSGDATRYARLGILLFQAGRIEECLPWLEKAATAGDLPATNLYGLLHLNGIGVNLDFGKALELLQRAASAGLKEASYTLAGMCANGFGMTPDFQRGWRYLVQAGQSGHLPALRVAGILLAVSGEYPDTALALLRRAAHGGDLPAQASLAEYLAGSDRAELKSEAGYWAGLAAARGLPTAKRRLAGLPESEPPASSDTQPAWTEIERKCPPQTAALPPVRTVVPDILFEADGILPPLVRDYLINLAAPRLMPSSVVDPVTGIAVQNPVRSSYSMYFGPSMYDVVMAYVSNTMAGLAGVPPRHSEPLAVLRYTPGQEYKPHMDYLVVSGTGEPMQSRGGQRVVTAFVYLSDVEQGGETDFPELKATIKPASGRAVKFYNLDAQGAPNPLTLHAGCPVLQGEKWLATFWFRQRPFSWSSGDLSPTGTSQ